MAILVSLIIVFINGCLTLSVKKFALSENRSTETHLNISIASKLSLAQFANTALLTLAANYFIDSKRIWSNDGLINDVFYIILTQAIVIPFNNYFSVFKLMRVYKRR